MIVEIYSDLIAPVLYRQAPADVLTERGRLPLERRWQPYELNPDMATGGIDASPISRPSSEELSGRGRSTV